MGLVSFYTEMKVTPYPGKQAGTEIGLFRAEWKGQNGVGAKALNIVEKTYLKVASSLLVSDSQLP